MRGPCSAVPRYLPTIHAVVETIRGPIFVRRSNMDNCFQRVYLACLFTEVPSPACSAFPERNPTLPKLTLEPKGAIQSPLSSGTRVGQKGVSHN